MSIWPADKVQRMPVGQIAKYDQNARIHSDAQVQQIAASMREWGFTVPVLIDEENVIIAGHGRYEAAQLLGWTDLPVMVATGWSKKQIKAYRIADNKLALNAAWDVKALADELGEMADIASLIGFDADEVWRLGVGRSEGLTSPDFVPSSKTEAKTTKSGDLWLCGAHRILCGSATKSSDVHRLLDGARPNLMVTDPPPLEDDNDWRAAWVQFSGNVVYCWHAGLEASRTQAALESAGFRLRSQIIWAKPTATLGVGTRYRLQHEPCCYAVREGENGHWASDRKQTTIWEIERVPNKGQKPVECMRRPISNNTAVGQAVYDPFVGFGTTLIAAEMEKRQCFGMDVNPARVDVTVRRWEAYTGQKATRESVQ